MNQQSLTTTQSLHALAYLRIWDIVSNPSKGTTGLLPIGRSSFLKGVKEGRYPKPVKLGPRTTAWRVSDIHDLLMSFGGGGNG